MVVVLDSYMLSLVLFYFLISHARISPLAANASRICAPRRPDHRRIDVFLLPVEQLAEIIVSPCLGKPLESGIVGSSKRLMLADDSLTGLLLVYIANSDDIDAAKITPHCSRLRNDLVNEKSSMSPRTDQGQIEDVAWRHVSGAAQYMPWDNRKGSR